MLTIWTATWSRPDMVQLLADALRVTAPGAYRLHVVVQEGGLRREWRHVHEVIDRPSTGTAAWADVVRLAGSGDHLYLHDDCIPMRSWTVPAIPCARSCGAGVIGSTLIAWRAPWKSFFATLAAPRARASTMPEWWSPDVRTYAAQGQCEVLLGGDFLHFDKSTLHHPESPYNASKPLLVRAVCRHLGIDVPSPLSPEELAFQTGHKPPVAHPLPDEDGGPNYARPHAPAIASAGRGVPSVGGVGGAVPVAGGPGTELKRMLRSVGIVATPTCDCTSHARQMDAWGPDECEKRLDEIVDWMSVEAARRKLPFVRLAAKKMVRVAIGRARKAAAG